LLEPVETVADVGDIRPVLLGRHGPGAEVFADGLRGEAAAFFAGLDLVQSGNVPVDDWHPDDSVPEPPAGWVNTLWCGIATKP
jgi:hypothetical protein